MPISLWMWIAFFGIIVLLLIIDLGVFHKKAENINIKQSLILSGFYIFIALLFGIWVWYKLGAQLFAEYLTGYLVEKSLSLDNIFVISLIFSSLSIPDKYQHRVLFFGIIGVLILRAIMISLGVQLVGQFEWILYVFSLFLLLMGIKMLLVQDKKIDIENNKLLQWMRKHVRITNELHGQHFIVFQTDANTNKKKIFITPLLVTLILVEFADLIFAVDSVPAIFTITQNSYIIYTSNIFAVLGLRSLYFSLAAIIHRFYYLKFSLAAILIFIGSKIFIAHLLGLEKFPSSISLGVTFSLLAFGCIFSVYKSKKMRQV